MRTNADTQREIAREAIHAATVALSKIVVDKCDGIDEYSDDYRATLRETFEQLLDMREEL